MGHFTLENGGIGLAILLAEGLRHGEKEKIRTEKGR